MDFLLQLYKNIPLFIYLNINFKIRLIKNPLPQGGGILGEGVTVAMQCMTLPRFFFMNIYSKFHPFSA